MRLFIGCLEAERNVPMVSAADISTWGKNLRTLSPPAHTSQRQPTEYKRSKHTPTLKAATPARRPSYAARTPARQPTPLALVVASTLAAELHTLERQLADAECARAGLSARVARLEHVMTETIAARRSADANRVPMTPAPEAAPRSEDGLQGLQRALAEASSNEQIHVALVGRLQEQLRESEGRARAEQESSRAQIKTLTGLVERQQALLDELQAKVAVAGAQREAANVAATLAAEQQLEVMTLRRELEVASRCLAGCGDALGAALPTLHSCVSDVEFSTEAPSALAESLAVIDERLSSLTLEAARARELESENEQLRHLLDSGKREAVAANARYRSQLAGMQLRLRHATTPESSPAKGHSFGPRGGPTRPRCSSGAREQPVSARAPSAAAQALPADSDVQHDSSDLNRAAERLLEEMAASGLINATPVGAENGASRVTHSPRATPVSATCTMRSLWPATDKIVSQVGAADAKFGLVMLGAGGEEPPHGDTRPTPEQAARMRVQVMAAAERSPATATQLRQSPSKMAAASARAAVASPRGALPLHGACAPRPWGAMGSNCCPA